MRIGILDSGWRGPAGARRAFGGDGAPNPRCDHGALVAELLRRFGPPEAELFDAQIFGAALRCAPETAAEGLSWLVAQGVHVVNASVGIASESDALREAVRGATEAGVHIVAATPIRGLAPAPARYPGVISATGDARCADGEISDFGGTPADFGASPALPSPDAMPVGAPRGGSSYACARVCAAVAEALAASPDTDPRVALRRRAAHRGAQTRPRRGPP